MGLFSTKPRFQAFKGKKEILVIDNKTQSVAGIYDLETKTLQPQTWFTRDEHDEIESAAKHLAWTTRP